MAQRFFVVLLMLVALVGCGDSNAAPTAGEAKTFGNACDKANDGKRIALQGYLRFPDSFTGDQSVVFRMYENAGFSGPPIGVQMQFGTQANQAATVPNKYTDNDLKVYVANGQTVGFGTKVKVSGKVYFPMVDQEFKCSLENPLVETAT